jgi:hypothetical protein
MILGVQARTRTWILYVCTLVMDKQEISNVVKTKKVRSRRQVLQVLQIVNTIFYGYSKYFILVITFYTNCNQVYE